MRLRLGKLGVWFRCALYIGVELRTDVRFYFSCCSWSESGMGRE